MGENNMKKILAAALAMIIIFSFSGCANLYEENAEKLVEANLNIVYKGECTEEYASVAGMTTEEAEAFYEEGLLNIAEMMISELQIIYPTEEITEEFAESFRDLFKKLDFKIIEANKKDENTMIVTLEIIPVDISEDWFANLETEIAILDIIYADVDFESMSEEEYIEYEHEWAKVVARAMSNAVFTAKKLDPVTIDVEVVYNQLIKSWEITEEGLLEVENTAFIVA